MQTVTIFTHDLLPEIKLFSHIDEEILRVLYFDPPNVYLQLFSSCSDTVRDTFHRAIYINNNPRGQDVS